MASSLAQQLAGIRSVDADRLQAATASSRPSFLFPSRQAASLNNSDIYSLAYNGYLALLQDDARLANYEAPIFGEKAKSTDRSMLTKDENARLDGVLGSFMRLLASKFLLKNTGKVLEWLIRRFRINEFNLEDIMSMILPYHETPQFAQMLQILKLENTHFQSFEAIRRALQTLPRQHLVQSLIKSDAFLRWTASMLDQYIAEDVLYSALVALWTSSLAGYLDRRSSVKENDTIVLLPVITAGVQSPNNDLQIGSLIVLSRLTGKVQLSDEALLHLALSVLSRKNIAAADEEKLGALLNTIVLLYETQLGQPPALPKKVVTSLAQSTFAVDVLFELAEAYAASKFLHALFVTLINEAATNDEIAGMLQSLLAPITCPPQILSSGLPALLQASMGNKSVPGPYLDTLSAISQRASEEYMKECQRVKTDSDKATKKKVDSLMASVSSRGLFEGSKAAAAGSDSDLVLQLDAGDAQLRAQGLSRLLKTASDSNDDSEPLQTRLAEMLLARFSDHAPAVVEVLFDDAHQAILHKLVQGHHQAILDASLMIVNGPEIPRATVLAHVRFLLKHFLSATPQEHLRDYRFRILTEGLWPKVIITKAQAKSTSAIWNLLTGSEKDWPVFTGCPKIPEDTGLEGASLFNRALAKQLCQNISRFEMTDIEDFVLQDCKGEAEAAVTSRILSQMIVLELLQEGNTRASLQTLAMHTQSSAAVDLQLAEGAALPSQDTLASIYSKPSSSKTLKKLDSEMLFSALLSVESPAESHWCWLEGKRDLSPSTRAYRALAVQAYTLAHGKSIPASIATKVLASLFKKAIRMEALAFLASIYTVTGSSAALRLIALRDTAVFLDANSGDEGTAFNDFQLLLPGVIVALSAREKDIRQAAMRVVEKIYALAKNAKEQRIYGFDAYYGKRSKDLLYLNTAHLLAYLQVIRGSQAEIVMDGSYLEQLHQTKLTEPAQVSRKKSLTRAVVSYLISHADIWTDLAARSVLLHLADGIHDDTKVTLIKPQILQALQRDSSMDEQLLSTDVDMYASSLIHSYDTVPKGGLSEDDLAVFLTILKSRSPDPLPTSLRKHARRCLYTNLFGAITPQQRLTILEGFGDILRSTLASEVTATRHALYNIAIDNTTMAAFVGLVQASMVTETSQANKRAKSGNAQVKSNRLADLITLLEYVDVNKIEASFPLLALSLEVLAACVEMQVSNQLDTSYAAQVLVAMIQNLTLRLSEVAETAVEGIRVSPILELIRISNNPQTSSQALGLIADLAAIVPDQVVQNVMPIFTFMGTNLMQRDDISSSRLVDKTIDSIVPALVKYRRQRSISRDHVVADLLDFIQVFADAASHVPRHRRNHLFVRFIEVLGPKDFVAPVCGLLVDKVAVKFVKSHDTTLITLPTAVMHSFPVEIQISAVYQLLTDISSKITTLNTEVTDPSVTSRQSTPTTPAESPRLPVAASRRTVLAGLLFLQAVLGDQSLTARISQAKRTSDEDLDIHIEDFLRLAISFYDLRPQKLGAADIAHILEHISQVIEPAARLLKTTQLSNIVTLEVKTDSKTISRLAMDLLLARLENVRPAKRQDLKPALTAAYERVLADLAGTENKAEKLAAYKYLETFTRHANSEDLSPLTAAMKQVLPLAGNESSVSVLSQQVHFLNIALPILGPRSIPFVGDLLHLSLATIDQRLSRSDEAPVRNLLSATFGLLRSLFQHVGTFVLPHLHEILKVLVSDSMGTARQNGQLEEQHHKLLSTICKTVAPKVLLAEIDSIWSTKAAHSSKAITSLSNMLSLMLKQIKSDAVLDIHKPCFNTLLRLLDVRKEAFLKEEEDIAAAENSACTCFVALILRLNESTFRPLFLRLYDWATVEESSGTSFGKSRQIVLFRVMDKMLAKLQTIALPYFSFVLDQTVDVLQSDSSDGIARTLVLSSLRRALSYTETSFWTTARLAKLLPGVVRTAVSGDGTVDTAAASELLSAYAQVVEPQESLLHDLVKALLKETRSEEEDAQLRAVEALRQVWDSGIEASLAAYSAESMPFLVETLETGGAVQKATKALLARMNEQADATDSESEDDSEDEEEEDD